METQDLELAAEFCKMVGSPHLLAYLGLDDRADPGEARTRLKSRRKFMQGMQGNPKYKKEALFLIKHFTNLNDVLGDVPTYLADSRRRAESEHLPVIEMTVRGVLAAGGLTPDQEDYLRRNALELGVSEQTFQELLARVATELGVPLVTTGPGRAPTPAPPPHRDAPLDLYQLLGISPMANEDDIRIAYQRRMDELVAKGGAESDAMRKRIEIARKVLSNEAARRHYDLTAARTGPPARAREFRPDQAATAPPVRERSFDPRPADGGTARLEILGEPVRLLRLGSGITMATISIRNGGDGAMPGVVAADVPWMAVDPTRLDPEAREQTISVQVDRADVPEGVNAAAITIQTDRGERARVVFELQRGPGTGQLAALAVAAVLLIAVGIGLVFQLL